MAAANAAKFALQLAVLPILAQILEPSDFGLVALAMPIFLIASMICDFGLGNAIVRAREPSRELESTIFWISVLLASSLTGLLCLLAWPVSLLLSEPKVVPFVIALSLILPVGGALSVVHARISRERRFGVYAKGEAIVTAVSSAAAIGAAYAGFGAWSLVVQQFTIWLVKALWLVPQSGFRLRFYCNPALARPYLRFGLNAAASDLVGLATKSAPPLIVGGVLGVAALGYYSIAYQIIRVPEIIVSAPIYLSVFTSIARWSDDRNSVNTLVLRGLRSVVTILAPVFCGLTLVADFLVQALFGPQWYPTAVLLILLAPAGFLVCVYSFVDAVLMGLGRSDQQLRLTLLAGSFMSVAALVGAHYSVAGVAIGLSVGAAAVAPAYVSVLAREIQVSRLSLIKETAAAIAATVFMAFIVMTLRIWEGGSGGWLQLSIATLVGVVSFAVALYALSWRSIAADLRWLASSATTPEAEPS